MKPINRPRVPELAVAALRGELRAGRWDGRLPGTRVLAKHLGVSPPTMARALDLLVAEGLLEKPGERQAYRVADRAVAGRHAGGVRRVLLLTHEEPSQLTETSRRILEILRQTMVSKGWQVDAQVVDFLHVKRPQRSWDRLLQTDVDTWVIALYGRTALAEWAVKRGVRMFFLGGITGGQPVPMVAVRSSLMLQAAMERLTALGHWKIVVPLCDRAEPFKESIREVMRRAIQSAGREYVRPYHNPESDYLTPDVTWRVIESAFASDPPTALVFLDWKELVTAQCVLMKLGLRIPEDVSLVLLNSQMETEWFVPELSRFRFPERRLVRTMVAWLEGRIKGAEQVSLSADFIEGRTIAAPREGG